MGNTLVIAREKVSAAEQGHGVLELTEENENLLEIISNFVSTFPEDHPNESLIRFKEPLTWKTNVSRDILSNYLTKKEDNMFELRENEDKEPILTVKFSSSFIEVYAYTFKALSFMLHCSKEFMVIETKTCLENNVDPLGQILGSQFSEMYQSNMSDTIMSYMEYALCTTGAGNTAKDFFEGSTIENDLIGLDEAGSPKNKLSFLKLLMILKEFDFQLLKKALNYVSRDIKLTAKMVEDQFELIKSVIATTSLDPILQDIAWLSPFFFVFKNGCRAPLWRQLHGDIAYIVVSLVQGPNLFITANTSGFFLNKRDGFMQNNDTDFERNSHVFDSLINLIREYSPLFNDNINEALRNAKLEGMMVSRIKKEESDEIRKYTGKQVVELDLEPVCFVSKDEKFAEDDEVENVDDVEEETIERGAKIFEENRDSVNPKEEENKKFSSKKTSLKKKKSCYAKISSISAELDKWIEEPSTQESDSGPDSDVEGSRDKPGAIYSVKTRDPKFANYWHIQNIFRYIQVGDRSFTLLCMCDILDFDLSQEKIAMSIHEANGVQILINILELPDFECQVCALKVLSRISHFRAVWQDTIRLGGIEILIDLLANHSVSVRCLAAECIGALAKTSVARQLVRNRGGLFEMVTFLNTYVTRKEFMFEMGQRYFPSLQPKKLAVVDTGPILNYLEQQWLNSLELAKSGAMVLASLANSKRARKAMQLYNLIPFLGRLIHSKDVVFLRSLISIISEFTKETLYRSSLLSEGIVKQAVKLLTIEDNILFEKICKFISRGAVDERIREEIFKTGEFRLIKKVIDDKDNSTELITSAFEAISKLCLSPAIVEIYTKMNILTSLVEYMDVENSRIIQPVLASMIELLKVPSNRMTFNRLDKLGLLMSFLHHSNPSILVCVNLAIAQCANEDVLVGKIIEEDGVRKLWSLLMHSDDEVKASAAYALAPCIAQAQDSGYMVRSLVGGLEILVKLLKSDNINVLAAVCGTVVKVVQDEESIGILTEFQVCPLLAKALCAQNHENINLLKANASEAIAQCCRYRDNRMVFGSLEVIEHLVSFLSIDDPYVQGSAARALYQLSLDANNIVRMHNRGCVKPLLKLIGSKHHQVQEAAAKCVSNIRTLAFANRLAKIPNITVN